ncbi:cytochrome C [Candidatus Poribacteria bacterium]|nr:MAG: cytochrome C [Candidatus Poribacteria bacterium]
MKRVSLFTICFAIFIACWVFLRFVIGSVISVPIPSSVISMYMGLVLIAILVHVSVEDSRFREFIRPIHETLVDENRKNRRIILAVLIPLLLLGYTYTNIAQKANPAGDPRVAHPVPPSEFKLTYKDKVIGTMQEVENPHRHLEKDKPEEFKSHVENGRRVYYDNCFYCHGDHLDGQGHFAHGLIPLPANFQDPGIIPNFQEAFFFWRISKGGPGLPPAGTPWNSAMPVWEEVLTEDEIWDVILFLSQYTGHSYRTFGEGH